MTDITQISPARTLADPAARDWFWEVVDSTLSEGEDVQLERLGHRLEELPDQDLVDFLALFQAVQGELYLMRLWAAAYIINGGCSDDGFTDFRAWLTACGRRRAEAAAADPDSLAGLGLEMEAAVFEAFAYVGGRVFKARSGGVDPAIRVATPSPAPDHAEWAFDFDDEAEMHRRLPKLAAEFL